MRIAKDLEAFRSLKIEDSIRQANILQYQKQLSLDSVNSILLQQKISFQSQIITDLGVKSNLQEDISKQLRKQNSVLKWERNGVIAVAAIICLKIFLK